MLLIRGLNQTPVTVSVQLSWCSRINCLGHGKNNLGSSSGFGAKCSGTEPRHGYLNKTTKLFRHCRMHHLSSPHFKKKLKPRYSMTCPGEGGLGPSHQLVAFLSHQDALFHVHSAKASKCGRHSFCFAWFQLQLPQANCCLCILPSAAHLSSVSTSLGAVWSHLVFNSQLYSEFCFGIILSFPPILESCSFHLYHLYKTIVMFNLCGAFIALFLFPMHLCGVFFSSFAFK